MRRGREGVGRERAGKGQMHLRGDEEGEDSDTERNSDSDFHESYVLVYLVVGL